MGQKNKGLDFDAFYRQFYPNDWDDLKLALLQSNRHMAFCPFLSDSQAAKQPGPFPRTALIIDPSWDERQIYWMDLASLWVAEEMEIHSDHTILDLCAAPGGKALVMASKLSPPGHLIANDRSAERRKRLKKVLENFISPALYTVTSHDARRWALHEKNHYQRILLDAPCSSERHVLQKPTELNKWSASRSLRLAQEQYAMLAAAYDALKPGGLMIYSTCSISPGENEGVIERLKKKRPHFTLEKPRFHPPGIGDVSASGTVFVRPDRHQGWGPIFFAKIKKKQAN